MLRQIGGRVHQVITAFTILGDVDDARVRKDGVIASDVVVVELDEPTIADYVASNEWRGKAGAYAIQGIGAALVQEVRGSVTNVIGLPLVEVLEALRAVGAPSRPQPVQPLGTAGARSAPRSMPRASGRGARRAR